MKAGVLTWSVLGASLIGVSLWGSLQARTDPAARGDRPRAATPASAAPRGRSPGEPAAPPAPSAPDGARTAPEPQAFPDLSQNDARLGLPGDGASYCGPVAVSDWLIWLADHGYPRLAPPGATRDDRQLALVRALSGPRYLATNATGGTGSLGLLRGLERWVADAGYRVQALEYAGWRAHDARHSTGQRAVDLVWLGRALREGAAGFVHVGWYRPPTRWELAHARRGGHWLAAVRADAAGDGPPGGASSATGELWLVDPAPYAGSAPATEHVRARRLEEGWLLADGDRVTARGALLLGEGMRLKRAEDLAIVDGAVVLRLAPP